MISEIKLNLSNMTLGIGLKLKIALNLNIRAADYPKFNAILKFARFLSST